jgi:hypothetical protein
VKAVFRKSATHNSGPSIFYGSVFSPEQKSLLTEQLDSKQYSLLESAMIYSIAQAIRAAEVDFLMVKHNL